MNPLRSHLEAVGAALRNPAMAKRALGEWGRQSAGPDISFAPPAGASEIRALEDALGRDLPATLRTVLTEVTSDIKLLWHLPGDRIQTDWGYRVEPRVTLPEPFQEWSHGLNADGTRSAHARRTPKIMSGGLYFGLEGIRRAAEGFPWSGTYDYMREITTDPEELAHYDLIEAFMGHGLPILTAPNGDWLAIDLRDDRERLLHVSHEGEEAGIELDLTLSQFLTHLTWLGPVWPDFSEIFEFSTEVTEVVPGDPRIQFARFDAEGAHGTIWRDWFWQEFGPPRPDPLLLARA